jgi:hypothetical protein
MQGQILSKQLMQRVKILQQCPLSESPPGWAAAGLGTLSGEAAHLRSADEAAQCQNFVSPLTQSGRLSSIAPPSRRRACQGRPAGTRGRGQGFRIRARVNGLALRLTMTRPPGRLRPQLA